MFTSDCGTRLVIEYFLGLKSDIEHAGAVANMADANHYAKNYSDASAKVHCTVIGSLSILIQKSAGTQRWDGSK